MLAGARGVVVLVCRKLAASQRPATMWLRWPTLSALFVVIAVAAGALLANPASAAVVWPPDSCGSPYSQDANTFRSWRCIAGASLRTRGYLNPACLTTKPVPGQVYPNNRFCRGVGREESIAQARAIGHLGAMGPAGVHPNVQWEVRLYDQNPPDDRKPGHRYVDLAFYDSAGSPDPVQMYELKQTATGDDTAAGAQLDRYQQLLDPVVDYEATKGTKLASWYDSFLLPTGGSCQTRGKTVSEFYVYLSWQTSPGVISIWHYRATLPDLDLMAA